MKMKNNDNDVYFLGNKQQNHLRKYAVAITFAVICALGIVYIFSIKSDVTYKQGLPTIETLPPNATSPKFKGRYDFTKFLEWVSKNLTYPTEHETEKCKSRCLFCYYKRRYCRPYKNIVSTKTKRLLPKK